MKKRCGDEIARVYYFGGNYIGISRLLVGEGCSCRFTCPGSADDPLVTKSYADKAIQDRVTDLEKTVAELSVQAQTLQNTLNELQNRVITTPTVKPEPTPVPKEEPKKEEPAPTPQLPADSMIGKTLCISTQNYANLRSAPTLEADVLKEVTADLEMIVQKVEGEWYNVKLSDGTIGWINQR